MAGQAANTIYVHKLKDYNDLFCATRNNCALDRSRSRSFFENVVQECDAGKGWGRLAQYHFSIMRMTKPAILSALFIATTVLTARAEWHFDADTGALYLSNLSNSDRSSEREDDWAWQTNIRGGEGLQLMRDLRLNLDADVRGELWDRFDDFDRLGFGGSASLRYRFGLGHEAPWISIANRFGYDRFQETERSGYDTLLELRGGFVVWRRVAIEAGYAFDTYAAPDNFYDRQAHRATARVIVDVTSALQLALGYAYREGEVISYAIPPRPEIAAFAVEREDEDTFGTNPTRTAYRFLGRTHAISVGAAYALTRHASIQFGYEYSVTSHDPLEYPNHLFSGKLSFAY